LHMILRRTTSLAFFVQAAILISMMGIVSPPAYATHGLITCTATLLGVNEVPPHAVDGEGTGTFTFDESTSTTTWDVTFAFLTAPASAAHIHGPAAPGFNAAVVVLFTGFPATTAGHATGSSTTLNGRTAAQFAGDLLAGNTYVNVHTATFPGGEIRGQLSCSESSRSVPEFGSLVTILTGSLMALAALKVTFYRRAR
jgi:hypothetical protein